MKFVEPVTSIVSNVTGIVEMNPNEFRGFECSTQNYGFPAAKFRWSVDGQPSAYPQAETTDCQAGNPSSCRTTSTIRFQASPVRFGFHTEKYYSVTDWIIIFSLKPQISCTAVQTDTYGNEFSISGTILVQVVDVSNAPYVLNAGQITGIVVGIVFFLVMIAILILAFVCGWCCFAGKIKFISI